MTTPPTTSTSSDRSRPTAPRREVLRQALAAGAAALALPLAAACGTPANASGGAASASSSGSASSSTTVPLLPAQGTPVWPVDPGKAQPTAGWSMYAQSGDKLELVTFGNDIWNTADNCSFWGEQRSGDGTWTCRVADLAGTNEWAKAGLMVRQTLDPNAAMAAIVYNYAHGVQFNVRVAASKAAQAATPSDLDPAAQAPVFLKLQKAGDTITVWDSPDGNTWANQASVKMTTATPLPKTGAITPIADPYYVGLCACSHDPTLQGVAAFDNVTGFKAPQYQAVYQKDQPKLW